MCVLPLPRTHLDPAQHSLVSFTSQLTSSDTSDRQQQAMSAPQLKLTYFDIPGRAELTRLILAYGDISYVDERIVDGTFAAMKPTLPLGQVPILEVDGVVYVQSMAMARFAAKISGLYPHDPVTALRVDMIAETLTELRNAYSSILHGDMDAALKPALFKKYTNESVPKAFGALETMVQGKFFLGDNDVTYADVQLLDFVQNLLNVRHPEVSTSAFPKLEAVIANVKSSANIAAYLAKKAK